MIMSTQLKNRLEVKILAQLELENKYSKSLLSHKLWEEVKDDNDLVSVFADVVTAKAVLVSCLEVPNGTPIQNFISLLMKNGINTVETAINVLDQYSDSGIYNIDFFEESQRYAINPNIKLDRYTYRKLTDNVTVLPPMLTRPRKWDKNGKYGGYLTVKHSAVLGGKNQHDKPLAVDALNKLQNIKWKLNVAVVSNYNDDTSYDSDKAISVTSDLLGQEFYFMWQFDKRGRMYSKGYEINLQSSEYHKAMLDFVVGEDPTKEAVTGLLIGIAECLGHDKKSWIERLQLTTAWLQANVVNANGELSIDTSGVEAPILLTKYVEAYYDALAGLQVHTPVALDCTASGLQILGAITGCESTCKAVNLINTGKREDVYSWLIQEMNTLLLPADQIDSNTRDNAKQALMTYWYGSKAVPEAMFNDKQLQAFYVAMSKVFHGPIDYMNAVENVWEDRAEYVWTLPDKHTAVVRTTEVETSEVLLDGMEVPFNYEETVVKPTGSNLHLFANIVHSIDGYVARELVRRCDFEVACIHDSFWCLPGNLDAMRHHFKDIMQDLHDSDILSDILTEIAGRSIKFNKLANLNLDGEYMLS